MNSLVPNPTLGSLALVLLTACASASVGSDPSGGAEAGASPCLDASPPRTLLEVDCLGQIVPGLAGWDVDGASIVLHLGGSDTTAGGSGSIGGPDPSAARRLVESWPALTAPPWLGHGVGRIVVLPDNKVRVEFGRERSSSGAIDRSMAELPLLLFADPRLAPPELRLDESRLFEDVRDRIDDGDLPVFTRHERSIGYGRALERDVTREVFDRRYLIVVPSGLADGVGEAFHRAVVDWWVRGGVEGARRSLNTDQGPSRCLAGQRRGSLNPQRAASGTTLLAYPAADPVAKEIAERLVSATLPGGALNSWLPSGLTAMPHEAGRPGSGVTPEMLQVLAVSVGPVHPCSIRGEILASVPAFRARGLDLSQYTVPVGETALFRIGPQVPKP